MRYIFATGNAGKLKEINAILASAGIHVKTPAEIGLPFEPEENGETFTGNAISKAVQSLEWLRKNGIEDAVVFADDSGLCIDALDGSPGVLSARFLGEETPYWEKNEFIIDMLRPITDENRTARFISIMAAAYPDGKVVTANGAVEGVIAREQKGNGGFGYDPIFFLPEFGRTMAELSMEEKNRISHRGMAALKLVELVCINL